MKTERPARRWLAMLERELLSQFDWSPLKSVQARVDIPGTGLRLLVRFQGTVNCALRQSALIS